VGSAAPPETCSRPLLSFTYEQIRVCPGDLSARLERRKSATESRSLVGLGERLVARLNVGATNRMPTPWPKVYVRFRGTPRVPASNTEITVPAPRANPQVSKAGWFADAQERL
jgi:hypothetical protein